VPLVGISSLETAGVDRTFWTGVRPKATAGGDPFWAVTDDLLAGRSVATMLHQSERDGEWPLYCSGGRITTKSFVRISVHPSIRPFERWPSIGHSSQHSWTGEGAADLWSGPPFSRASQVIHDRWVPRDSFRWSGVEGPR
jgi:hypothetical protein